MISAVGLDTMVEAQIAFDAMGALAHTHTSAALLASQVANASFLSQCDGSRLYDLDVFGAEILAVDASPLQNTTVTTALGPYTGVNVCNVTVSYTHPGRNDTVHVDIWLPLENWNGRFQGVGGGGWSMGPSIYRLAEAASEGYAVARTDGGHSLNSETDPYSTATEPENWALQSPGNVNLNLLADFAYLTLNDLAVIGKQITANFYGTAAKKSYWNGCSTGGRQGLMLAQKYPDAFDGILAIAPAINFAYFLVAEFWPQHVMNRLGYWPAPCELEAITAAAIEACDRLDGVADGIISSPSDCDFDATSVVGNTISCNGTHLPISSQAATIANAAWTGPRSPSGRYDWYGLAKGTPFYNTNYSVGLAGTTCTNNSNPTTCTGSPFSISEDWIKYFVQKNPAFNTTRSITTDEEYFHIFHNSIREYDDLISASDPDLSDFKHKGGKMITWHGLADELIFPGGSVRYYESVLDFDPDARAYYRFFEAPGVGHCAGGQGPLPDGAFESLVQWVEEEGSEGPETLVARDQAGGSRERELCAWPKRQRFVAGDGERREDFVCVLG